MATDPCENGTQNRWLHGVILQVDILEIFIMAIVTIPLDLSK